MGFTDTPRPPAVAGRFYPGDAAGLRAQVAACLAAPAPPRAQPGAHPGEGEVLAVMVPHAGYVFSGQIAGMTLAQAAAPDRIILLGPNHTGRGQPLSVWNGGGWATPLGTMKTDRETAMALVNADAGFMPDAAAHTQEHSLEVIVPFLQVHAPGTLITPVTIAGAGPPALARAGEALAAVVAAAAATGERILLVVSSDMSHFLPHDATVERDAMALEALVSLDPERFFSTVRENDITMCGVYPMTIALYALNRLGVKNARVTAYATSGQTGQAFGADMSRVVGYAGVVFTR